MDDSNTLRGLSLYVLARHPLAFRFIEKLLAGTACAVKPYTEPNGPAVEEDRWILIVDTYSVKDWPVIASQSRLNGARTIILIDQLPSSDEEVRLVYVGVHGIVLFENAEHELAKAVGLVSSGGLWISRNALAQYANRAAGGTLSSKSNRFTGREQQILFFLERGFSNKEIGNSLKISERTVKFHVSNVLQKLNVDSRRHVPGVAFTNN